MFLLSHARRAATRAGRLCGALVAISLATATPARSQDIVQVSTLLDISGVSWLEDDRFLAVHDGKANDEERSRPRASLLLLPGDVVDPPG